MAVCYKEEEGKELSVGIKFGCLLLFKTRKKKEKNQVLD
jgi:hypothetical protein